MTREELIAAAKRRQLLDAAKQRYQQDSAPAEPVAEPVAAAAEPEEQSGIDTLRGGIQSGLKGLTVGFGDEIVGAGRAALSYPIEALAEFNEGGELPDRSPWERYEQYRDDERGVTEQFADENPGSALALELGGGLLSPINKIAPGLGRTGTATNRLSQSVGRGAAEGALYGLGEGEGDLESQIDSMKTGAMFGGGASGVLTGAGGALGRTMSKRRVAKELLDETTGDFTPMHLADKDGLLGDIYRNTIGRAWGGKRALAQQEKPFLEAGVDKVKRAADDVVRVGDDIDVEKLALKRSIQDAKSNLGDQGREAVEAIKVKDHPAFRAGAINDAIPETMPTKVREEIAGLNPREAEARLSKWWVDEGFQTVKGRKFEWDGKLKSSLRNKINSNPALLNDIGDTLSKIGNMENLFGGVPTKLAKTAAKKRAGTTLPAEVTAAGRQVADMLDDDAKVLIDGEALMEMRNFFAKASNKGLSAKGKNQRTVADAFDSMMFDQLGDDAAKYADELAKWGPKQWVSAATRNAKKKGRDFTPDDWLSVSRAGDTPARRSADQLVNNAPQINRLKKTIKRKATEKIRKLEDAGSERIGEKERKRAVAAIRKDAQDELDELGKAATPKGASGLSSMLTTSTLGAPIGMAAGLIGAVPAALASGTGIAKLLSTQGAQKTLAGQTGVQRQLAQALRKGGTQEITRALSRASAGQAVGE